VVDKVQEIVDEIAQKEPKAYLFGIPVYTSKSIPENEMLFIKIPKPDYRWMVRAAKELQEMKESWFPNAK